MSKNILLILFNTINIIKHEKIRYHSGIPRLIISCDFIDWVFSSNNYYFWHSYYSYNTKYYFFKNSKGATR